MTKFDPVEAARKLDHIAMDQLKAQRDSLIAAAKLALPPLEAMAGYSRMPEDRNAAQAGLDALNAAIAQAEGR